MTKVFPPIGVRTIIQMNDVWSAYDAKSYALKSIKLSIDKGTNYAIVGVSGSGKSTLIKLLNGMMRPSRGVIKINYQTPDFRNKEYRKMMYKIGYIPQTLGLVKNLSVKENILVGALPRVGKIKSFFGSFPKEEYDNVHQILDMVGLSDKIERQVHMLSGGEKRRVAIARALIQKPDILLADEIVSELDHVTAREIMDLVADAQKRIGLTAVMVHHDIKLALEYANRVAVIKEGQKILEIGVEGDRIVDFQTGNLTPEQILEMYQNES